MANSRFVYVTFIRTTPEKLWQALTDPSFTRQYWGATWQDCQWKQGSEWKLMNPNGQKMDSGHVEEYQPYERMVISWQNHSMPEVEGEGHSRLTYHLEPNGSTVKLTVTHEMDKPESRLIGMVSNGWPIVLASLKSLLETGESIEETRTWKICSKPKMETVS